jgi:hypothetical protein
MSQQLVLTPLGLVTEPNKLGQVPAGALSAMTECVERSPGILENLRAWTTRATIPSDGGTTAAFLIATPGPYMLVVFNVTAGWRYCWFDQTSGAQLFGGSQTLTQTLYSPDEPESVNVSRQPGFQSVIVGDQIFVNLYSAILVWDTVTPTSTATGTPRIAGLQPVALTEWTVVNTGTGTALPPLTWAACTVVVRRQVGDKVLLSAPSNAAGPNNSQASLFSDSSVRVRLWPGDHRAGDVVELYRTKTKPSGEGSQFAAFQRGEEVGAEYQRAAALTVTAADITATFVDIVDRVPDSSLGEALYTNQAIGELAAAAPPAVRFMTSFKGYLFGFDTTHPPAIQLRPKGIWADIRGSQSSMSAAQISSGLVGIQLAGCTWSNGGTTVTVSPTSQLALLSVGQSVFGTGLNATITAIGGSTFTFAPAASGAGTATTVDVFDAFDTDGVAPVFGDSYKNLIFAIGDEDNKLITAPALKLPPYTLDGQFVVQPTDGFSIERRRNNDARGPMTVRSSHGANYDPAIANKPAAPTIVAEERKQGAMEWSEKNAPEAWPSLNRDFFARGTPCAVASTRDAIIAFYTDAIWRVSGTGGRAGNFDWRSDPIATNITASGSQVLAVLSDVVYAQTSDGLIGVSDSSIQKITQGRVHDQLDCPPWTDGPYTAATARFTIADEEHNEILFREPSASSGRMWLYNTNTDRLAQTISHANPFHGDYSRFLRLPLVVGKDGSTWTVKAQAGSYADFSMTYATVYADNPFAQRHWQTLNVSAETAGAATIAPTFNGVAGSARTLGADGRCAFEVPRNAPAIGNTMQIGLTVATSGAHVKLHGFSLDYRDHTERRGNR